MMTPVPSYPALVRLFGRIGLLSFAHVHAAGYAALLRDTPAPSREQIQAGLAGNLCRCGTYGRIFEAVEQAARVGKVGG